MYAIREIADIENNLIKITLPEDFPSNKAEIIIFPVNVNQKKTKRRKPELPELVAIDKHDNYSSKTSRGGFGSRKGEYFMAVDFDEPLEDFKEYMQ
jgi:hypothetical protein